ncbi:hypothetical protein TWF730_001565 [Orbilia blumenaviensis]|uniref:Copper transporter n=1 Tax=Orbilia blumenaviensis TaxID=1796055 RepID=A0AAV9ULQ9_9PEZI
MAPAPEYAEFRHILAPRYFSDGYYNWWKVVFISVFCCIFLVFFIRIIWWYRVYTREQREWIKWWQWNSARRQEQMQQQQNAAALRAQHQRNQRQQQQHWHTRPNMRNVPMATPQPAVLRMHIVSPPPPPPPPVNMMFVMVNVPDDANGVQGGQARNAHSPGSPTHTNQFRREGIVRADERSGHQRTPSRTQSRSQSRTETRSNQGHQRTPSRTQSRAGSISRVNDDREPPPAYQP